jgi:hypothetical protein
MLIVLNNPLFRTGLLPPLILTIQMWLCTTVNVIGRMDGSMTRTLMMEDVLTAIPSILTALLVTMYKVS